MDNAPHPAIGEIWYFFDDTGTGSGEYVIITSATLARGVLLKATTKHPMLRPRRKELFMNNGGFRYVIANNTLTNAIKRVPVEKLRRELRPIIEGAPMK